MPKKHIKSDNLEYNTLGHWVDRLIDHASDCPSITLIDLKQKSGLLALKTLYSYFCKVINTWNIRFLIDEMIGPLTQRSVYYIY